MVATGSEDELLRQFPVQRLVRLDGVLLPGFNDAHAHPTMTAENLLHADCSPEVATDADVLVALLRREADAVGAGAWVVGSRYDHTKTTGGRVVDRWFLDDVVAGQPALLMHVAAHWGVLNSAGLAAAGLDDDSADPPGGSFGRDGAGRLNGVLYEQAFFDVAYASLSRGPPSSPRRTDRRAAAAWPGRCDVPRRGPHLDDRRPVRPRGRAPADRRARRRRAVDAHRVPRRAPALRPARGAAPTRRGRLPAPAGRGQGVRRRCLRRRQLPRRGALRGHDRRPRHAGHVDAGPAGPRPSGRRRRRGAGGPRER